MWGRLQAMTVCLSVCATESESVSELALGCVENLWDGSECPCVSGGWGAGAPGSCGSCVGPGVWFSAYLRGGHLVRLGAA